MAKFKSGDKIIFTQNDKTVSDYKIGDKGVIIEICGENSSSEHYTIELKSGKLTWAEDEEVALVSEKQKKWLKATEERIAQLQVGDKVKLRNGEKATIIDSYNGHDCLVVHDSGEYSGYMACEKDGSNCLGDEYSEHDIVKIKNKNWVKENA